MVWLLSRTTWTSRLQSHCAELQYNATVIFQPNAWFSQCCPHPLRFNPLRFSGVERGSGPVQWAVVALHLCLPRFHTTCSPVRFCPWGIRWCNHSHRGIGWHRERFWWRLQRCRELLQRSPWFDQQSCQWRTTGFCDTHFDLLKISRRVGIGEGLWWRHAKIR